MVNRENNPNLSNLSPDILRKKYTCKIKSKAQKKAITKDK